VYISSFLLLQLLHRVNIYPVLVGIEVWTDGDRININRQDLGQTQDAFCSYRKHNINPYHNNDNAQLIS